MSIKSIQVAAYLGFLLLAAPALATNGPQLTGAGSKAAGMGGVSIALPQDATSAANNPAGMAEIGNRVDADIQFLLVHAQAELNGGRHKGDVFVGFPEIGYNREIGSKVTIGFSTAASGAAFTYDDSIFPESTQGRTSGLFASVAILPTVTYKVNDRLAVGASLAGGFQIFELKHYPGVPKRGLNSAFGTGWRAGLLWKPVDKVTIGASYVSKLKFGRLKGYANDLLASVDGHLDQPAKAGVGIAVRPIPRLTISADYQHIAWGSTQFSDLFGYRDQNVVRGGAAYDISPKWTVRGGISLARRQFSSDNVLPNVLLIGVNSKAYTAGITRRLSDGSEISFSAENSYGGRYDGTGLSVNSSIKTKFYVFSIGWGRRL